MPWRLSNQRPLSIGIMPVFAHFGVGTKLLNSAQTERLSAANNVGLSVIFVCGLGKLAKLDHEDSYSLRGSDP
jgi:cellobiose-specific phosphotransferase system component IIC